MTELSLNVRREGVSTPQVLSALQALKTSHVLIQDDVGRANELHDLGYTVVFRSYWPESGDDNLHRKCTPNTWIDHMLGLGLVPGILWYAGNEPTMDYDGWISWTLQAIAFNHPLVVGNFSTWNPPSGAWSTIFKPVLQALSGSHHILGLHEYIIGDVDSSIPDNIGRFKNALGIVDPDPEIWITEGAAFDLYGSWQSRHLSANTLSFAVDRLLTEVYGPAGIPVVFGFSFGPWQNGAGEEFNLAPAIPALAAIVKGQTMPEIGYLTPKGEFTYVRSSPEIGENIVGGFTGLYKVQRTGPQPGGGHTWYRVDFLVGRPGAADLTPPGYVAFDVCRWLPAEPCPEVPPPGPGETVPDAVLGLVAQARDDLTTAMQLIIDGKEK